MDAFRKPKELLEFAGLSRSDKVLDVSTGFGGYLAKHMASMTDKPVDAQNPSEWRGFFESDSGREALKSMADSKIDHFFSPMEDPGLSKTETYDLIALQNAFHDLYDMPVDRSKFFASLHKALKPDGHLLLVDHRAEPGRGSMDAASLHRVEEGLVRSELAANGFTVTKTSNMFTCPEDDHDTCAWTDPARETDRFVFLCRKVQGPTE